MKAIIFDADHTLYRPRTERAYQKKFSFLSSKTGVPAEKLREKWKSIVSSLVENGIRDSDRRCREYSTAEALRSFGIEEGKIEKLVEEALKVFWSEIGLEFDPEVKNIIAKLKEKYRLCVASDEFRKGLEMKLNKVFGDWKKYFEFIVSAEDAGELKPSKRFCEIPLEKFGFGPEDVIFVGDSWERDLEEAHKMNIKTVLVREEKEGNPDFWIKKITDMENVFNI